MNGELLGFRFKIVCCFQHAYNHGLSTELQRLKLCDDSSRETFTKMHFLQIIFKFVILIGNM